MKQYFLSENLKLKYTMASRIVFLAPLAIVILTFFLEMNYFQKAAYNWWTSLILPGYIALLCSLQIKIDDENKNKSVLSLPVDLKKVYYAKILVGIKNLFLSTFIIFIFAQGSILIFQKSSEITIMNGLTAVFIIVLTSMWMIPFFDYMYMAVKAKVFVTVILGIVMGFVSAITAVTTYWIVNPFGYTCRAICPVLKLLPNGLDAVAGNKTFTPAMLDASVIPVAIVVSTILFVFLSVITANAYSKKEAV